MPADCVGNQSVLQLCLWLSQCNSARIVAVLSALLPFNHTLTHVECGLRGELADATRVTLSHLIAAHTAPSLLALTIPLWREALGRDTSSDAVFKRRCYALSTRQSNWGCVGVAIAFVRANAPAALRFSVLPLVPMIRHFAFFSAELEAGEFPPNISSGAHSPFL